MESAEPAEHVEQGDPHFDDFFPFLVREGNREVPFRKSRVYRAHLTAWSRRSASENAADVRRLLPRLKNLREPDASLTAALKAPVPPELAALGIQPGDIRGKEELFVRSLTDALWFRAADDLPLWCLVADAAFSPRHWRELRAHNPKLAFAVERLCRPEVNRTAGRPSGTHADRPSASEQDAMRATARKLERSVREAKLLMKRSKRDPTLMVDALNRFDDIANAIRPDLKDDVRRKKIHNREAMDIIAFFVAEKHRRMKETKTERKLVPYNVKMIRRIVLRKQNPPR